jgi:hypothetical protein
VIVTVRAVDGDGDDRRAFVDRSTSRRKGSILVRRLLKWSGLHEASPMSSNQNSSNQAQVSLPAVKRASEQLVDGGSAPMPEGLTPHSLRRTFASVLYALGEDPGVVMDEMGHTDPSLALRVYRQTMRCDDDENTRLRDSSRAAQWQTAACPVSRPRARTGTRPMTAAAPERARELAGLRGRRGTPAGNSWSGVICMSRSARSAKRQTRTPERSSTN